MRRTVMFFAAFALIASAAQAAPACRDAKGKFIKCAPAVSAGYKLDAKGNCHDSKGKMAKKTLCAA